MLADEDAGIALSLCSCDGVDITGITKSDFNRMLAAAKCYGFRVQPQLETTRQLVCVADGTVHLRVGSQTAPQTLKIGIVVTTLPVTVPIPANYQVNSQVLMQGGPVLLNNFGGQYDHGGFVPPSGAEITVTTNPLPRPPLNNFIWNELRGATINSTTSITVSNASCTEVTYTDSFGLNTSYSALSVYCPHNQTLYKLFLFFRAGDPGASQFVAAFQQVLSTIQFTY